MSVPATTGQYYPPLAASDIDDAQQVLGARVFSPVIQSELQFEAVRSYLGLGGTSLVVDDADLIIAARVFGA